MKKLFYFSIVLFTYTSVYSQKINRIDNFDVLIREAVGDLNRDNLKDSVVVNMDTIHETIPLRLQIFFAQPNGKFKLIVSSTKIIEAQYPVELGGEHNGNTIPNFYIENGNLLMECYVEGDTRHEFRFKNGNFELIHFSKIVWDGKETTTETKYNLVTGNYIEEYQLLGSDKFFEKNKNKIEVKSLPKIQDFIPFENELY